jgi:hypothetical protein
MPYCSKCGTELAEDARFCPSCGTTAGLPLPEGRRPGSARRRPMRTLTIALIVTLVVVIIGGAIAAAVLLGGWQPFGRVVGSGNLTTENQYFSGFTSVEVGSGFEAEISESSSYSIAITADDNLFDYIEVSRAGDTLTIRLKWWYSYQDPTLRAKITVPNLYELELSGGTHGTIEGFSSSHEFAVELSGGSWLTGDFTTSEDAEFTLSGGSQVTGLDGGADDLAVSASSGSHLDLSDFHVRDAEVDLSGGSHATINLDGQLDADVSGGSQLLYIGDPTLGDINTSGGSTVHKK